MDNSHLLPRLTGEESGGEVTCPESCSWKALDPPSSHWKFNCPQQRTASHGQTFAAATLKDLSSQGLHRGQNWQFRWRSQDHTACPWRSLSVFLPFNYSNCFNGNTPFRGQESFTPIFLSTCLRHWKDNINWFIGGGGDGGDCIFAN